VAQTYANHAFAAEVNAAVDEGCVVVTLFLFSPAESTLRTYYDGHTDMAFNNAVDAVGARCA
jgi:hypothetical protein